MPKIKDEKTFKRISVALSEEIYNGVKALSAVAGTTITDYVANILAGQVKQNSIVIEQMATARKAYEKAVADVANNKNVAE
jgi:hypothetical protein